MALQMIKNYTAKNNSTVSFEQYKDVERRYNDCRESLRRSMLMNKILQVVTVIMAFAIMWSIFQINSITKECNELKEYEEIIISQYSDITKYAIDMTSVANELDDQLIEIADKNDSMVDELEDLRNREELYDKYNFAMHNNSGERTDLTYDELNTLEDIVEENDLSNDLCYLTLAVVMTESKGKSDAANPNSTAKGYGQLLNGTAKMVYEKLLMAGDYKTEYAFDGKINIRMTAMYLSYLNDKYNGDIEDILYAYRGVRSKSYYNQVNSYLNKADKDLSTIEL